MKPFVLFLFLSLLSLGLSERICANEKEEFERILKESTRSYGLDSQKEHEWAEWSGLNTISGFQFATENLLESDDRNRRRLSYFAFRNTRVPKNELIDYLKKRSDEASEHGEMKQLERGFRLLLEVKGDASVAAYWAEYFADDRIIETSPRNPETTIGEPLRVSDVACGLVKGWLQQQSLWDPTDPDCHQDPGGFMMWEGRDNTKEAINRFLLKKGFIDKAEQPSRRKWEHDYSTAAAPTPAKVGPARPRKGPDPLQPAAAEETSSPFSWPWLAAALVLFGWAVARYLRKRST